MMEARRARRREKKKQRMARQENIPCNVFLATDEESFELAEKKEDRQLRYINQYADAHGSILKTPTACRSCAGRAQAHRQTAGYPSASPPGTQYTKKVNIMLVFCKIPTAQAQNNAVQ